MHLTSDGEKMLAWAEEEQNQQITDSIFSKPDRMADSYYEKRCRDDIVIYEYDFSDFAQLRQQLTELWKESYMQRMILISTVSAMKGLQRENGGESAAESENKKCNTDSILPEYVYVF